MNHIIDDMEQFMRTLYEVSAAKKELDKKMTKSLKRKKTDGKLNSSITLININ